MPQQQDSSWLSRNGKWFIPAGCLASLALLAGFIALIIGVVFGMLRSSSVYQHAVAVAKQHPAIQQAIGTPIEEGFLVSGSIRISGPSGEADLAIPISGPDGKATVYVVAKKSAGQWSFSTLTVEIQDPRRRLDLLAQEAGHSPAPDSE